MRADNHFIALFDYLMSGKLNNYLLIDLHPRGALLNKEIKIRNILLGKINELGETSINCYGIKVPVVKVADYRHSINPAERAKTRHCKVKKGLDFMYGTGFDETLNNK